MSLAVGLVYRWVWLYRLTLRLLYGAQYRAKYDSVIAAIPPGSSVVDLCCGDCMIAPEVLAAGGTYIGLDINPRFVRAARKRGLDVRHWDGQSDAVLQADVVCIQSSLYQFMPQDSALLAAMFQAARERVVISEPVVNMTGGNGLASRLAIKLTSVGGKEFPHRHTRQSLDQAVGSLAARSVEVFDQGRECLYVVSK